MGGDATFSGTSYQARVAAFVGVHVLAQARLGWLNDVEDIPSAVSGETGGVGDDLGIECGSKTGAIEVQTKHGLRAGAAFNEFIARVVSRAKADDKTRVVLAVDRGSSAWIYDDLPRDLQRVRSGRTDGLKATTERVLDAVATAGGTADLLFELRVVPLDLDSDGQPEAKLAIHLLRTDVLEDPTMALAAWLCLTADASEMFARRERRTRQSLVRLLTSSGIKVRPLRRDDLWHKRLDHTRQLLQTGFADAALAQLNTIEKETEAVADRDKLDVRIRCRIAQQRSAAYLILRRGKEALLSAQRALDIEPHGVQALVCATHAAILTGDTSAARVFAERAVTAHPVDPEAWSCLASVHGAVGGAAPTPPPEVAESFEYRVTEARLATQRGDHDEVLAKTAALIADGHRRPDILFDRANALITVKRPGSLVPDESTLNDVVRLSTEILKTAATSEVSLRVKALVLRSNALHLLGDETGAKRDVDAASEIQSDDADALNQTARMRAKEGDYAGARDALLHPAVSKHADLLAWRALMSALLNDDESARRDIARALDLVEDAADPDAARSGAAQAALMLGDIELATRVLDATSDAEKQQARHLIQQAELAVLRGRLADATLNAEQAVAKGAEPQEVFPLVGSRLAKAGQFAASVAFFSRVPISQVPRDARGAFASALLMESELTRLKELIDHASREGELPSWALAAATELAIRQEDVDTAIQYLTELVNRDGASPGGRIMLARLLLEAGRRDHANPHLDFVRDLPTLSPADRMNYAQVLHIAGRKNDALPYAYRAFREKPGDPRYHRAFIVMTLMGGGGPPVSRTIEAGTYARLKSDGGQVLEYTILQDEPIDGRRNEIGVDAAKDLGILGKQRGASVRRNTGVGLPVTYTIEEILPAWLHAANDAAEHYAERFPGEPFFVHHFTFDETNTLASLTPILASIESRRLRVQSVLDQYAAQRFPLGFVAKMLGESIPAVMQFVRGDKAQPFGLVVESAKREESESAQASAESAKKLVLARSALETLSWRSLLHLVLDEYEVIAPRSLQAEVAQELVEATGRVASGHSVFVSSDRGLHIVELAPGDAALELRRESLAAEAAALKSKVALQHRPLDSIGSADSEKERLREMLGLSSYDAIALANSQGVPLLADDLGLRRMPIDGRRANVVSSIAMVYALQRRGKLTDAEARAHLLELAANRFAFVMPTAELLTTALDGRRKLAEGQIRAVFGTLANPLLEPVEAARAVANLLRAQATAVVQLESEERIVHLSLDAMSRIWPSNLCAQLVVRAAEDALPLLPRVVNNVRAAATAYLRRQAGPQIVGIRN